MTATAQNDAHDIACEGNLFIVTVQRAAGRVTQAWSTGKMIHNMNYLLGATVSADDSYFVQRIPCLCNAGHALTATRALEQLVGLRIPDSARLVRNIVFNLQYLIDHLTSFYLFYGNDWCSPELAVLASPEETLAQARKIRPQDPADERFYREAREQLIADGATGGQAQPGYAASPADCLLVYSHRQAALAVRAKLTQAQGLLQGAASGETTWHVGGLTHAADQTPGDASGPTPATCAACVPILRECRQFITETFLPDVLLVGRRYRDWAAIGRTSALLSWGEFPGREGETSFFPRGVFTVGDGVRSRPASPDQVAEEAEPAWQPEDAARYRLRFGPGQTTYHWNNADFRWFTVPRYAGQACEVGPLARLVGAYAHRHPLIVPLVDTALRQLDLPVASLNSTLGRVLARGIESAACIQAAAIWLDELTRCVTHGETPPATPAMPQTGEGIGLAELTRGALSHHIRLENRRIVLHASLVPSLWNFSPRSSDGTPGPLEQALPGTPIADPQQPIELLRVIHTFDPCNACVLRIEDRDSGQVFTTSAK